MPRRYISTTSVLVVIFLLHVSDCAPSFKFKKSYSTYDSKSGRAERRMAGGSSPIHYISPYMSAPQSMNTFSNFFAPVLPMGSPSSSTIYKLPLRLYSNGKPHAVFHGFPKTQNVQNVIDYLPQAMSNIIRLPLKYLSNAKPVGVYFKDPTYNFL